jgi:hypothetical protein
MSKLTSLKVCDWKRPPSFANSFSPCTFIVQNMQQQNCVSHIFSSTSARTYKYEHCSEHVTTVLAACHLIFSSTSASTYKYVLCKERLQVRTRKYIVPNMRQEIVSEVDKVQKKGTSLMLVSNIWQPCCWKVLEGSKIADLMSWFEYNLDILQPTWSVLIMNK